MEIKTNKIRDNSQLTSNNKENNYINQNNKDNNYANGVISNQNNINEAFTISNQIESINYYKLNFFSKAKKKINDNNKLDKKYTNSTSFLDFRKYSNGNKAQNKNCDHSATLNDNNINVASLSNISYTNLLEKNDNLIKKMMKKENFQENQNLINNKINTIYDNNFIFKLKTNKEIPTIQKQNSKKNDKKIIFNENLKYDKIKINNFFTKSKTFNDKGTSQLVRKNTSKILKRYCFICEVFQERLYRTKNCNHLLCKECIRSFYEQQTEKGIYNLKCPKYSCLYTFNLKDIKEILTFDTYRRIECFLNNKDNKTNKDKLNERKSTYDNNVNDINYINYESKKNSTIINNNNNNSNNNNIINNKINEIKYSGIRLMKKHMLKTQIPVPINKGEKIMNFVLKEHMIKISDYTKFKSRVKNEKEIKKMRCSKCGKSALFSREDKNFIRCLNCGNAICKYCYKRIGCSNSLKDLNSICGICYGRMKLHTNITLAKKLLYENLFVISGFIIVWIGFSKKASNFFFKRKKRKKYINCLYKVIFVFFLIINLIVLVPFMPYFPIIITVFG